VLTIFREELTNVLLKVPALFDEYARGDISFVDHTIDWHTSVEAVMVRFRSQSASQVAVQRGRILAAKDGYQDPALLKEKTSSSKAVRFTAMACLTLSEAAARLQVEAINGQLDPLRLKMAQLISVASALKPIPYPPTEPHTTWLLQVWDGLLVNGDTRPMFNYLKTSLALVDRLYLLDELISNTIS